VTDTQNVLEREEAHAAYLGTLVIH
jgi:hypothetical protein